MRNEQTKGMAMNGFKPADLMDIEIGGANVLVKFPGQPVESDVFLLATTDHPASSYSVPVLVDQDGVAYGPSDLPGSVVRAAGCGDEMLDRLAKAGYTIHTK